VRGADCLAQILASGEAFGLAPGSNISDVTATLGSDYVEQRYGRGDQRLLRRDYGLLEVTFVNEPDWRCAWLTVELQRLASHEELIVEAHEKHGVSFSRYTSWSEVRSALDALPQVIQLKEVERQAGFQSFSVNDGSAVIRIVDSRDSAREEFPGDGDVWGLEIRQR
jgi:hypothetical protein